MRLRKGVMPANIRHSLVIIVLTLLAAIKIFAGGISGDIPMVLEGALVLILAVGFSAVYNQLYELRKKVGLK